MKTFARIVLLALLVFVFALPVLAQEGETPEAGFDALPVEADSPVESASDLVETPPEPETLPVVDPGVAADLLIKTVSAIVLGAFGNAPITSVLVSVLKRIPGLESRTAPELTFGVATFLWVIAAVAGAAGYGIQLNSLLESLTTIIPAVLGLMTSLAGAPVYHEVAAKANVPVLGYKRTPGIVAAPLSIPDGPDAGTSHPSAGWRYD